MHVVHGAAQEPEYVRPVRAHLLQRLPHSLTHSLTDRPTDRVGGGAKCQECDVPPDGVQQTLKVAQLETLVAKFGFQKQARTTKRDARNG